VTEKEELLDQYEASGDERTYVEARRLYEAALATAGDQARLQFEYGYLQECRGRFSLRAAAASYERAIQLMPDWEKPRHRLIAAQAALHRTEEAIALYQRRLAETPDDPREYRFLAHAYLVAQEHDKAEQVILAGLELAPDHPALVELLGEVCAATGHPEEALTHWRRVFQLDPELIDPHYSAAFLLERLGRLEEAVGQWSFIVDWLEAHDFAIQAEWPKRELARLEAQLERR
jgi:tetratricopeptide (TPR) repeat protein